MAEAKLETALLSLEQAAKRLTNASNLTNDVITTVQTRVVKLSLGMAVFISAPFFVPKSLKEPALTLGFEKLGGDWCIVTKQVPHPPSSTPLQASITTPLLKASLEVRRISLPFLPTLLKTIEDKVNKRATELEEAVRPFAGK